MYTFAVDSLYKTQNVDPNSVPDFQKKISC